MRGVCPGPSSSSRFPGGELQSSVPAAEPHTQGAAAARCCNRRASLAMWLHFVPLPPRSPTSAPSPGCGGSRASRGAESAGRGPPERLSGAGGSGEFERGRARSCCRDPAAAAALAGRGGRPLCPSKREAASACVPARCACARCPHTCVTDRAESQLHSG